MEIKSNEDLFGAFGNASTLRDSSLDDHDNVIVNHEYMTEKKFEVVKIDDFAANQYREEIGSRHIMCGVDSFFSYHNKYYFIEFKNGVLDSRSKRQSVLEKMYASPYIVIDKLNISVDFFRKNTTFILVYNYEKNTRKCDDDLKDFITENDKAQSPGTTSNRKISDHLKTIGSRTIRNSNIKKFSLDKLEKNIYFEVFAIPEKLLDRFLKEEGFLFSKDGELIDIV